MTKYFTNKKPARLCVQHRFAKNTPRTSCCEAARWTETPLQRTLQPKKSKVLAECKPPKAHHCTGGGGGINDSVYGIRNLQISFQAN